MWEWDQMNRAWSYTQWLYGPRLDWLNGGIYNARWW